MNQENIFHILFIAISLILIKYRLNVARYFKIMDIPNNTRKLHSKPISATGGIILFQYVTASLIYLSYTSIISTKHLMISLFLICYFFILGLLDDRHHLNAKVKIFFLLIVLLIVLPLDRALNISVLTFKDLGYVIELNQGSLFFTIFCIFFLYNALNFADGVNGVALGLCLFWLISIILSGFIINVFLVSIIISLFLLLIPNLLNKIFIGNSGVNFLSIVFSLIFINSYNNNYLFFDQIILLVFLPSIDMLRIVIERIFNDKSPLEADQNHFHHLLCRVIRAKYVFLPYLTFAVTPFLLNVMYLKSYIVLMASIIIYFVILFFLKNKNA